MNLLRRHFRITVKVHQLKITVKFPCTVLLSLKHNNHQRVIGDEHKLVQGVCNLNESASIDLELIYDTKTHKYYQSKIQIAVYLKSASGKIPAGASKIQIKSQKQFSRQFFIIEKCPDKNARIQCSLQLDFIRQEPYQQIMKAKSSDSQQKSEARGQSSLKSYESYGSLPPKQRISVYENKSRKDASRLYSSDIKNQDPLISDKADSQSRISRMIMREHQNEVSNQRMRIMQLQKEKSQASAEIRNLKHQLEGHSLKNSAVKERQENMNNYLLMQKQETINTFKQQLANESRRLRQSQLQIHRSNLKIHELENTNKNLSLKLKNLEDQILLTSGSQEEYEIKFKNLYKEHASLKEQLEDLLITNDNLSKKLDFKQSAFKQQLKVLHDRYTQSESQKQKLLLEKNELINNYELKQKQEIQNIKKLEKNLIDEKNVILRNCSNLEKKVASQKQQIDSLTSEINEAQLMNKKNKHNIDNNQVIIHDLNSQLALALSKIDKEQYSRNKVEQKLTDLQKSNEQLRSLRKKVFESQQVILVNQKNIMNLETSKKLMAKKISDLEETSREKLNDFRLLKKQNESLSKELQAIKKIEGQKAKQIQQMSNFKQTNQSKVQSLNQQKKDLQKKYSQIQAQLKKQVQNMNYKIAEKDEEYQQACQINQLLTQKVKKLEILLKQNLAQYENKIIKFNAFQKQYSLKKSEQENYKMKIQKLIHSNKQLQLSFARKEEQYQKYIKQLQNQIRDQQIGQSKNNLNNQYRNKQYEDTIQSLQGIIKNKERQIKEIVTVNNHAESSINSMVTQINGLQQQLKSKTKSMEGYKKMIEKLENQNIQLDQNLKQTQFEVENLKREIIMLKSQIDKQSKIIKDQKISSTTSQKQLQKYKATNIYQIKSFLTVMAQEELPSMINIHHQNQEIVKAMINALQIRKKYENSLHQSVQLLEQKLSIFEAQRADYINLNVDIGKNVERLTKDNEILAIKNQSFESSIIKLKEQLKQKVQQAKQLTGQLNQLKNTLPGLQQKLSASDKMNAQKILTLQKQNQQYISKLEGLSIEFQKFKKSAQIQAQKLKKNISEKNIFQNEANTLTKKLQKSEKQIERLKNLISEKQKKQEKLNEGNRDRSNKITELERQNKLLTSQFNKVSKSLSNLNEKNQEQSLKIDELKHLITAYEGNNSETQRMNQKIINYEITIKGLRQKVEKLEEKITSTNTQYTAVITQLENKERQSGGIIKKLGKEIQNITKAKQTFQAKLIHASKQIQQLQSQQKEYKKQITSLQKQINVINKQNLGQKQRYLKQNQSLKERIQFISKEKQQKIKEIKTKLEQTIVERDFYQNQVACMEKQIIDMGSMGQKDLSGLKKNVEKLKYQKQQLQQQLSSTKQTLRILHSNLNEISRSFQNYQLQNNNNVNYLQPILEKLNCIMADCQDYTSFVKNFQASKNKLLKINSTRQSSVMNQQRFNQSFQNQAMRELNITSQKCKLHILNKIKVAPAEKQAIIQEFKKLQIAIEKIKRK